MEIREQLPQPGYPEIRRRDPANKASTGAVELYFIYRGQLSPDEIFKAKLFPYGPIRDVAFEAGFGRNTKNTQFGSQKWLAVAGPNIHFNVPGFLNVGLHYAQEWNHNGIVGRYMQFDPTFEVEAVYSFPIGFIRLPLRLEGFANLITPKGRDAFGAQTQLEILSQTRLTLDLGGVLFQCRGRVGDASQASGRLGAPLHMRTSAAAPAVPGRAAQGGQAGR